MHNVQTIISLIFAQRAIVLNMDNAPFLPGLAPQPRGIKPRFKRLVVSFSGGKTSAYMTLLLLTVYRHLWEEVVVVFANTGQEHEKTLEYVEAFGRRHGIAVVWLEAKVNPKKGGATEHRVVRFETASRKGEPFEDVIEKYGIPNPKFFHCTRELKLNAIKSYLNYIGWFADTYDMAVGIRADEMTRQSPRSMDAGVFYPLLDLGVNKADVLAWDLRQSVRLGLPEHLGNCVWCWKKSFRKLATVALEMPRAFEFPARMERFYKDHGAGNGNRRFFRGQRLTSDIFEMARDPGFQPFVDYFQFADAVMDEDMACGDGCEIGVDGPGEVEPVEETA